MEVGPLGQAGRLPFQLEEQFLHGNHAGGFQVGKVGLLQVGQQCHPVDSSTMGTFFS